MLREKFSKKGESMKVCTKCVMDKTDKDIIFNDQGVCNHCLEASILLPKYQRMSESTSGIESLIKKVKTGTGNYDCLIGLSGGIDSSYVALLAKKWGLRPLCLHFDNGWNSDISVKNIRNIIKYTGFDYETLVINWPEFKSLQRAYLRAGVIDIEALTDHAIFASMIKISKKENIRFILSGTNYVTEHGMPKNWSWHKLDLRNIKSINKKYGELKKLKTYPKTTTLKWLIMRKLGLGLEFLEPLNLIPFTREGAMQELKREFDWQYYGGKHHESVFTKFYQSHILPVKFNIDKRKVHFSALIRTGEMTREKAIKELLLPVYDEAELQRDFDFVAKKLGFTNDELSSILKDTPVSHKSFKTDQSYIAPLISLAKWLGIDSLK